MSTGSILQVAVILGSQSDWETMSAAAETLETFDVRYECRILSAHRTPRELAEFIDSAEGRDCQ
ncbi:MAG TPA: AIR carboxylase family protein, partial [Candidatus Hydrogenedentes bacterium]|nr:AIR carboxylase family protein [Candidatus Hydrogenedentota bacterium]